MLSAFDFMNYFSRFSYESRMHSRIIYHAIQYIVVLLDLTVIYFGPSKTTHATIYHWWTMLKLVADFGS